jgi:hypothetical protein
LLFRSFLKQDRLDDARKELGHLEFCVSHNKQNKPSYLTYWKEKGKAELRKYYEDKSQ